MTTDPDRLLPRQGLTEVGEIAANTTYRQPKERVKALKKWEERKKRDKRKEKGD